MLVFHTWSIYGMTIICCWFLGLSAPWKHGDLEHSVAWQQHFVIWSWLEKLDRDMLGVGKFDRDKLMGVSRFFRLLLVVHELWSLIDTHVSHKISHFHWLNHVDVYCFIRSRLFHTKCLHSSLAEEGKKATPILLHKPIDDHFKTTM